MFSGDLISTRNPQSVLWRFDFHKKFSGILRRFSIRRISGIFGKHFCSRKCQESSIDRLLL
eukprot:438775-Amorphochlora_amoeboformis.AAC.1